MNKPIFAISASIALTATHAMASINHEVIEIPGLQSLAPENTAQMEKAISKSHVRDAVNQIFNTLANNFSEEGVVLNDKYFNDPELRHQMLAAADTSDSTNAFSDCYANCHSACHSACHGSRGWR